MADLTKVRFLQRTGIGGVYFAAGVVADINEKQAAYFVNIGVAEYATSQDKADAAPKVPTKGPDLKKEAAAPKVKTSRKK